MSEVSEAFAKQYSRLDPAEIIREEVRSGMVLKSKFVARFGSSPFLVGAKGLVFGVEDDWRGSMRAFDSAKEAEDALMMDDGDAITIYMLTPVTRVYASQALKNRLDAQGDLDLNKGRDFVFRGQVHKGSEPDIPLEMRP